MPEFFADRLFDAVRAKKTPAIVALDPVYSQLPAAITDRPEMNDENDIEASLDAVLEFCRRVIRVVAPLVPAIKINSAFFERYLGEGIGGYYEVVEEAADRGLIVIGDVKRGDVGHSAEQYAAAHLAACRFVDHEDTVVPDAITVSPYLGLDGVKPFIDVAYREGRGVFVLVRTSNESAGTIQDIAAADGRKLHEVVAARVAEWAEDSGTVGRHGFSSVGAVVAARDPADAARLRSILPKSILLVPGYGAQGGTAEDVRPYFNAEGLGALVAAGRSVIFAYNQPQYAERHPDDWEKCVEHACKDFVADLARVLPA